MSHFVEEMKNIENNWSLDGASAIDQVSQGAVLKRFRVIYVDGQRIELTWTIHVPPFACYSACMVLYPMKTNREHTPSPLQCTAIRMVHLS